MKTDVLLSDRYKTPLRSGLIWVAVWGVLSGLTLDMGEVSAVWRYSVVVYTLTCLLVLMRRPATPTALDLLALKWGFPLLYLSTRLVYPLVWHQ